MEEKNKLLPGHKGQQETDFFENSHTPENKSLRFLAEKDYICTLPKEKAKQKTPAQRYSQRLRRLNSFF
ncbi:MAG: hypothetical protein ACD_44C00107G0009 [uncultured bacterium]|nr:MAG: hypothetical protein ACD_44C00107G0009 [uncultured bacterium]OGT15669.1 MAG: hypothetical protein A3B69_04765 [Gammaproteobacteria bacterium RIFCSPHIGHO2_02_FULL_38_33]OGT23391.1 MAG: hypothetical protein A2W47_04170 [Gammaproteobacteria bacterium RIFCSPHIGHO2_12_38_15]OGT66846.1 MAG: hypothetical protein A3I12_02165 [Gammaproteobacteria bacterium RIFCSPLOWO2_02_FULL_38_11]OGT75961.1 MAG: hypothetical protein A3G71_04540 [Gammaproteobacteria bacterium RIFCSPLOWO2_12_FULL_38_14]